MPRPYVCPSPSVPRGPYGPSPPRSARVRSSPALAAYVIDVRAAPRATYFPGQEQQNGAESSAELSTLAPLEACAAVSGPPRPLPDMEDVEARFAHLLQPIRDLTKNWEVDVAAQLGEYLEEVRAASGEWRWAGGAPGPGLLRGLAASWVVYIRRSGGDHSQARFLFPNFIAASGNHPLLN